MCSYGRVASSCEVLSKTMQVCFTDVGGPSKHVVQNEFGHSERQLYLYDVFRVLHCWVLESSNDLVEAKAEVDDAVVEVLKIKT